MIADPSEVAQYVEDLNLSVPGLLAVRDAAYAQRNDASPLMAINAPGSLAYHYGVLEIRQQFLGEFWQIDRIAGIEGISHTSRNMKLAFQNVDEACSKIFDPKPCSDKGAGAERECEGNLFEASGVSAPKMVRITKVHKASYYVMVDEKGAVELSRPVIENGRYSGFIERVFISDGSDIGGLKLDIDGGAPPPINDFDVTIARR
ncbi:MAG: hypothetical protein BGN83_18210 [Rhizobium sp. 63-7]|nr:MAG: hypothetical protein BGN83_18210 [Rhizobium sp. 63-7]